MSGPSLRRRESTCARVACISRIWVAICWFDASRCADEAVRRAMSFECWSMRWTCGSNCDAISLLMSL
eukprot:5229806-Pyramimonas_sp.AAC.1